MLALPVQASGDCGEVRAAKEKIYGFRPAELNHEAQKAKSEEMDGFWKLVKQQGSAGAACLAALLQEERDDGFFLFDGASLLFSVDPSEQQWPVIVSSVQRSDLSQIDMGGYVHFLVRLGKAGADIGGLARLYLEREKVDAYLTMHSMQLERWMGAMFMYGSMPAELSGPHLREALKSESQEARGIAAMLLALNMNEEGFRALHEFPGFDALPAHHRDQAKALRTFQPYQAPKTPPKFTRQQVLEYLGQIAHTREEVDRAFEREMEWEEKHPELQALRDSNSKDYFRRKTEESPPFTSLSGHVRFLESAIATLTEADLAAVREARRRAVAVSDEAIYEFFAYTAILHGVVNRLDLYKEYRLR